MTDIPDPRFDPDNVQGFEEATPYIKQAIAVVAAGGRPAAVLDFAAIGLSVGVGEFVMVIYARKVFKEVVVPAMDREFQRGQDTVTLAEGNPLIGQLCAVCGNAFEIGNDVMEWMPTLATEKSVMVDVACLQAYEQIGRRRLK